MSVGVQNTWALLLLALPLLMGLWAHRRGLTRDRVGRLAIGLRTAVTTTLILALADFSLLEERDELSLVYVVDGSRSVGSGVSASAREWVAASMAARPEGDGAGIVVFAGSPEIERLVRSTNDEPTWAQVTNPGSTNVEAALRLAMASFPADTHRRIVLLSDGVETGGRATRQAEIAQHLGIPIDAVVLEGGARGPDVVAENLTAPPEVNPDEPFDLRFHVRSPARQPARVLVYRNDKLLGAAEVTLSPGLDTIVLPQTVREAGLHRYRVVVETKEDSEPRNNVARATVLVEGQPRVLIIAGRGGGARQLRASLEGAGFAVSVGGEADFPTELEDIAAYDALILSNVAATNADRLQLRAVAAYVEDLGRGLVMIGGDHSFGLGGYYKTPVERVLPVRMTRKAQIEMPSQGIVLTIDRSGSMGGGLISKMELAKEAAVAVVDLLRPADELGVIAFTSAATWVVAYGSLDDKDEVTRRIGTMRAGGGTDIFNALRIAHEGIRDGEAATRHIILLSDGITSTADFPEIIAAMRKDGVTLTTVSIGSDSDRHTMEKLAQAGGGRYYETDKAEAIPQIFTRETMLASRSFLINERFVPTLASSSDVIRGIDALPPLGGYVATSAKNRATVVLTTPSGDPLLAHWRAGLGRSLAFTSDADARWASAWIEATETYDQFWTQAVRWVATTGTDRPLALVTSLRGGSLTLTVDTLQDGAWSEGAETTATVIGPGGIREELPLRQVAPGRYRATTDAAAEGTWYVSVVQRLGDREIGRAVRELHRPWSPEFAPSRRGLPLLQNVAARTGGVLNPAPDAVWIHPDTPITTPRSLVPWLLLIAVALWLLDIAWRRLGRPRLLTAQPATPAAHATRSATPSGHALDEEPTADDPPPTPATPQDPPSYTSRLLKAKRRGRR
jgi:uncharacterized membrane protein